MAIRPSQARLLEELAERYGREVSNAFAEAINDLRTAADIDRVIAALASGDIEGAIRALHLDIAVFGPMTEATGRAFNEGGRAVVSTFPVRNGVGTRVPIRFGRTREADAWIADRSGRLITAIMDDQRAAVRTSLTASLSQGVNPRQSALRIVGPINPATGRREGGILGLSSPQEQYVRSAREELASGDPQALRHYLTRGRRNRSFDRSVNAAIREGKALDPAVVNKAVTSYSNRLLKLRGEAISRTETLAALNAGSFDAIRQAVESGRVPAGAVKRVWRSAGDIRVRHSHQSMNGDSTGLYGTFTSPSGARLRFPGDTSLGASAAEVVNCRCIVQTRIDYRFNEREAS